MRENPEGLIHHRDTEITELKTENQPNHFGFRPLAPAAELSARDPRPEGLENIEALGKTQKRMRPESGARMLPRHKTNTPEQAGTARLRR